MSPTNDDEIDLFELLQILWDGRWLIITFIAVSILSGGGFVLFKDKVYESKISYSIGTTPPFYSEEKVSIDFQKKFYSISVFEEWKKNNENALLEFGDFSTIEILDGISISKSKNELLAILNIDEAYILVRSNQLPILNDFYNYSEHINELLKDEYLSRANDELKILETRFKDLSLPDSSIVQAVLESDRYIVSANKGEKVFFIERPSIPQKVSPRSSYILVISSALGGFVGAAYVFILNVMKRRREVG